MLADVGAGEVATVDLTLEAGHVLTGVVRAADSGAPIAGARVGLADVFRARLTQKWMPGEVTTDAAGGFALTDVPAGEVALLVEHEAFVRRNATATAGPGAGPVDVRLERPATLEVRIVQADGTPAPFGFRATVKPEDGPTRVADAVDGVAVIEGLPPGRAGVACLPVSPSRSFSTTTSLAAGETKEVRFELSGGATVRGRLVDASGLGLDLHAFFVVVQEDAEALGGYLNAAFVAPDGTFRFDHAPVGDVVVALHGRAGTVAARDLRHVRLAEGEDAELTFEIGASGLRGRVVDRAGRGLDATVAVRATDAARGTWTRSDAASDGSFTILHRPAPLLVSASAAGFGTRAFPRVLSDQRTVLDERIVLDREARLELFVTDVDGEPVDAVTVRVAPEEVPAATSLFRARRVDEKRLLVERLPAGRHLLEVSAPGTVPHRRTVVLAPGDVRRETLRLRFAVDVELGFVDARGRPLGALAVRVEPSEDDPPDDAKDAADARTCSATTDAAGTIVLPGLPEGSYAILAGDRRESLVLRRAPDDAVAPQRFLVTLD